MKKQLCIFFGIILLNQFCSAGQIGTYSQTGKVIDYNGKPVSGVTVICYHHDSNLWDVPLESCNTNYTSSDGTFSFDVSKGRCVSLIVAYKSGLALGWAGMNIESELSPTIRLSKPAILKGIVVDDKSNPVKGADMRIYLRNEMMSRPEDIEFDLPDPENWYSRKTDARGQFLFHNIPEGSYAIFHVKASGKASICVERDSKSYTEYFAAGRDDIRIVLPAEARIKGQVIDETTGQGLANIKVKAAPENNNSGWFMFKNPEITDSNGWFEFTNLDSDKYLLTIKDNNEGYGYTYLDVESGRTIENVKIMYKKKIPFEIKIYDPEEKEHFRNAEIMVSLDDPESGNRIFSKRMTTDVNGIIRLNLIPGESNLEVTMYDYGSTINNLYDLAINPELNHGIEVSMYHGAFFYSGQVVDEKGSPLAGAEIMDEQFGPRAVTDANGNFDTKNIHIIGSFIPASADIIARHESTGLAALVRLKDPNRTGNLKGKVVLKPAYTIKGKVIDPNGKAIPAAYVQLVERRVCSLIAEVATDADGQYSICSIPYPHDDLDYFIVAHAHGYNHVVGGQVHFTNDVSKIIEMQLIKLLPADKVISGIVVDANEQPVSEASLKIYAPKLLQNYRSLYYAKILTDKQGRFYYKGVSGEPLEISAKPPTEQQKYGVTYAHGGDTDIKIVLGQTLYYSRSLIGEKLPTLKDFGIDSIQDGNQVLLCFFDIEQRPSRNCITELNKRIQGLNEKGIEIIAIQAAKSEQSELDNWIKENDVSFQVGMIQEDEDKVRTEWGIEALPWMILTDKEHIVIAEGFSINEIDEKIGKIQ